MQDALTQQIQLGSAVSLAFDELDPADLVSRWDVVGAYTRATSTTASSFLDQLLERMPFPVRAIQVDGGSEFEAAFEEACQKLELALFVLPPRSPKLNGHVERAQRTHTEEFYEIYDGDLEVGPVNQALCQWERVYNTIRPHQSLGYLTPLQYLQRQRASRRSASSIPATRRGRALARGP